MLGARRSEDAFLAHVLPVLTRYIPKRYLPPPSLFLAASHFVASVHIVPTQTTFTPVRIIFVVETGV